jgi:hypothetical protein
VADPRFSLGILEDELKMVSVRLEHLSSPISLAHDPEATKLRYPSCIYWAPSLTLQTVTGGRPIQPMRRRSLGAKVGANRMNDFPRHAYRSGQADGDYARSRIDPDDAERLTGIYGSKGRI